MNTALDFNAALDLLDTAGFSVSSRVALQLGRESISSSITAIVELVKNAYDADAGEVRIRFSANSQAEATLTIEDTGIGMAVNDLRDHWLVIGTSNKTEKKKTAKQRTVTGEKGLGRLGLDRLCSRTLIDSFQANNEDGVRLDVQWEKYEASTSRLESVEHNIYRLPQDSPDPATSVTKRISHGTRLTLLGLKDTWSKDVVQLLRNELALLVSPFQGPNDFSIEINTSGQWPDLDGSVATQQPLLEAALWKVVATLSADSMVDIQMTSDRHSEVFAMEPTKWSDVIKKEGNIPFCGPLRFEFYFFLRRDADLASKTLKAAEIVNFLKFNQGVRIYRDGFRVKPYGEPDGHGDWLRLAFRRMQNPEGVAQKDRPGNWRVGYNQIVGAVFITHESNPGLNDQTNREGLLQGKAFDHLNVFASRVIQFFETNHQLFEINRKPEKIPAEKAEEKAKSSLDKAHDAIKSLVELTNRMPSSPQNDSQIGVAPVTPVEIRQVIDEVQSKLETATLGFEESAKLYKQSEEQKNTMANLASLGILAASFGHETLDWTGTIAKNTLWLRDAFSKQVLMIAPNVLDEITSVLSATSSEAQKVRKFARFTLGNLSRDKRRHKSFDFAATVGRVFGAFAEVLGQQRNTQVDLSEIPSTRCLINGYEMDWESVVVNFITNASWALEDTPMENRKIKASIKDEGLEWLFSFHDSGVGLEAGTEDMIFLPAFSTKRSKRGETIGTGMGLFIIQSFVQDHSQGTISAEAKGLLGGASFHIRVPKTVAV